ncbi:MAG: ferrous iron transport protein B [Planctomycetota bacterium]|nr:ferrous iron transport protein B [Planctomycetota bacterium]
MSIRFKPMDEAGSNSTLRIALIGNPNTGKSTLFSRLSGIHQRTGNYPGVTVEKRVGFSQHEGLAIEWIDLPGSYSLVPRSPDEWVTVDVLLGQQAGELPPDGVVCVLDASNLERNLYLLSQLLDLQIPVIVALNMVDLADRQGVEVDLQQLAGQLDVPVVATQANKHVGVDDLLTAVCQIRKIEQPSQFIKFPELFEVTEKKLAGELEQSDPPLHLPRFLLQRLLLQDDPEVGRRILGEELAGRMQPQLVTLRESLQNEGIHLASVEATSRYGWVGEIAKLAVEKRSVSQVVISWADRLDRILVHKFFGTVVFLGLMLLMFQSIFAWADPLMGLIESFTGWIGEQVAGVLPEGLFQSLIVDGVIAGVGGVLVFLPQILILFLFIGLLEDCGYMARAAFLMDRLMAKIGLNGKSFIPLLSSFACAIPGIMATRTIENPRDRLITILVAPLMSCSARLPVYTVLIAAFIPDKTWAGGWIGLQGFVMFAMYLLGIVVAIGMAFTLKKTLLRGASSPFLLELPPFKVPSAKTVASRVLERGGSFVKRAGTLILSVTVLVWAAATFPQSDKTEQDYESAAAALQTQFATDINSDEAYESAMVELDNRFASRRLRESFLGRAGQAVEPMVRPLGWDWKIGCAVLASFPAREVVIGTMGVIYQLGGDQDEQSQPLREALKQDRWETTGEPVFNVPVALSIMVFFALCAQCSSTLVVIWRETASWQWPLFTFGYMTGLAYVAAFMTYQIGNLLGA